MSKIGPQDASKDSRNMQEFLYILESKLAVLEAVRIEIYNQEEDESG